MNRQYRIEESGVFLALDVSEKGEVFFLHCQRRPFAEESIVPEQKEWYRLVEIQAAGEDCDDHHACKYTGTLPGRRLVFTGLSDERTARGRCITVTQKDGLTGLKVKSILQFIGDTGVLESWTEVENLGQGPVGLTYVSSFCLNGLTKDSALPWDETARLYVPSNSWYGEFQWNRYSLPCLGMSKVFDYSTKRISVSSTGTWTSAEFLPMGFVEDEKAGEGWYFSIIHNGSWHWEVGDSRSQIYLQLSGPAEAENHWYHNLKPGETFQSVPVAVAPTDAGFEDAVGKMTAYRRAVRRKNEDNEKLPVIFNDFMNCLGGDPTAEKEYPLIDAAAEIGCEYYTIDAGWYANGSWWSRVGEWEPAQKRWPDGIDKVLSYIRQKGMVPGLWLEIEVIGIHCPMADELPDDWFFMRHGKRVIDHGRYQLDFRNPQVREFADGVIRRLVEEYGAGYIKMDYNIDAGIGTQLDADSAGDGLLGHNRAYLEWLDHIFETYPDLIIENCGSGGMRITDAMLSRHSIQSSSDQTDYLAYAAIAAAAPAAVTPEQNAVWSYPLKDADAEQTAFNMVNAMLMRIHQSGHLARLSEENRGLIREAIAYYKRIRPMIKESVPFWPLGMPAFGDGRFAVGFAGDECAHLALWRTSDPKDEVSVSLLEMSRRFGQKIKRVELVYPAGLPCEYAWEEETQRLTVKQPQKSARLFGIVYGKADEG